MKKYFLCFLMWCTHLHALEFGDLENLADYQNIVISTKRIVLNEFPDSFNPSLLKVDDGFLLIFRYIPQREEEADISYIGIVKLNDNFDPISVPQLLNTRQKKSKTLSQAEDARLFSYGGRIFVIYNDNIEKMAPRLSDRRDMFIAELTYANNRFFLLPPLKLVCLERAERLRDHSWVPLALWEKNWVPFEYENKLLLVYSITPHEILYPNLVNGDCYHLYETFAALNWNLGSLKGGTPAILVDGEYLSFFHSGKVVQTEASWGYDLWHYFMGAYTFSATAPFTITKFTPVPIVGKGFYTQSWYNKRVIFPGSFAVSGSNIYLAYGKDDYEMWIATIDKEVLKKALKPVKLLE